MIPSLFGTKPSTSKCIAIYPTLTAAYGVKSTERRKTTILGMLARGRCGPTVPIFGTNFWYQSHYA